VRLADQPQKTVNHEENSASRLEIPETAFWLKILQDSAPANGACPKVGRAPLLFRGAENWYFELLAGDG
jgi:hypothetical protein